MKGFALAGLVLALPGLAAAESRPVAPSPESCTPLLTVRKTGCAVEHAYRCTDGTRLNAKVHIKDGVAEYSSRLSDADYLQILSVGVAGAIRYGDVPKSLGVSQLLAHGGGEGTYAMSFWTPLFVDPLQGTSKVHIEVTDREFPVDGAVLVEMRGTVEMQLNAGAIQFSGWGEAHFDPRSGVVFDGSSEVTAFGKFLSGSTEDPIALIYPGEPGFLQDLSPTVCDPVGSLRPDTSRPVKEG